MKNKILTTEVDCYNLYYNPSNQKKYQPIYIGTEVWDGLTQTKSKVIRIIEELQAESNWVCYGIYLDNDYLGGGRHPWEISPTFDWLKKNDPEYFDD